MTISKRLRNSAEGDPDIPLRHCYDERAGVAPPEVRPAAMISSIAHPGRASGGSPSGSSRGCEGPKSPTSNSVPMIQLDGVVFICFLEYNPRTRMIKYHSRGWGAGRKSAVELFSSWAEMGRTRGWNRPLAQRRFHDLEGGPKLSDGFPRSMSDAATVGRSEAERLRGMPDAPGWMARNP